MEDMKALLWPDRETFQDYSQDQWVSIVHYLFDSFESFLTIPLRCDDRIEENVGKGFCIDVRSRNAFGGPIAWACRGILGCDLLDQPIPLSISAILFLYSREHKLITTNDQASYLSFTFEPHHDTPGIWVCSGWEKDIYDEYCCFDHF